MNLVRNALTHYKTTLCGFAAAFFTYWAMPGHSWQKALAAALLAALGAQAKDGDKP